MASKSSSYPITLSVMKMASNNQWEVVGKSHKKNKGSTGSGNKKQKNTLDSMPKFDKSLSVKENPTVFTPFIQKEKEKEKREEKKQEKSIKEQQIKENDVHHKVKLTNQKKKDHKKERRNLEEVASKITVEEVKTTLTEIKIRFPDNPSLWLKELASYLNLKLNMTQTDPVYSGKPSDYPLCALNKNIQALMLESLHHCTQQTKELFFDYCIFTMLTDIGKGLPAHGYHMFIQCIAFEKPEIVGSVLNKYLDMVKSSQNRPPQCQAIMWALGQSGYNDLSWGLKIWLELMFPVIGIRSLAPYSVEYLENLLNRHKKMSSVYGVFGVREFFPILDFIFTTNSGFNNQLQKRLMILYPKIKALALGESREKVLQQYFPSFLSRLKPSISRNLKEELLSTLVMCLSREANCYGVWRQMYTKHLSQSSILLQHFLDKWDKVYHSLQPNVLKDTIRTFTVTNNQISGQGRKDESYHHCVNCCKELMQKMRACQFPWRQIFFVIFTLMCGIIAFDILSNGSFKNSKTFQLLRDSGILALSEQAWIKSNIYLVKGTRWCQENIPHYYSRIYEICDPYVQLLWQKLYAFGIFMAEATKEQRLWLMKKIPQVFAWVDENFPIFCNSIYIYLVEAWIFIRHNSIIMWKLILHYAYITSVWLQENILIGSFSIENIQKTLGLFWDNLQNYTLNFYHWVVEAVSKT